MNILNFEQLNTAMKSVDYCFHDVEFSSESINKLKAEIDNNWNVFKENSNGVLIGYYNIKVPENTLKKVLKEDLELAFEVFSEGIYDTCQRSILVNSILQELGMRQWPTYGEGGEVFKNFINDLENHPEIEVVE